MELKQFHIYRAKLVLREALKDKKYKINEIVLPINNKEFFVAVANYIEYDDRYNEEFQMLNVDLVKGEFTTFLPNSISWLASGDFEILEDLNRDAIDILEANMEKNMPAYYAMYKEDAKPYTKRKRLLRSVDTLFLN